MRITFDPPCFMLYTRQVGSLSSPPMLASWRAKRAYLVVRMARFFVYIYIYIFFFFGARALFSDIRCLRITFDPPCFMLYTRQVGSLSSLYRKIVPVVIRNVKYKGQQLFCHDISSCFKRFVSKLTAWYSDTTRVVGWPVTR